MLSTAAWIGHRVMLPSPPGGLRVFGVTSRGIFLLTPQEKVIFLSYEAYRGPLTINLLAGPCSAQPGEVIRWDGDCLVFPLGGILQLAGASSWQPPDPPAARIDAGLFRAVALEILARKPQAGLAPLLGPLFNLPFPSLAPELRGVADCLAALRAGADPVTTLSPILGLGRGLTPSGDDFIAGWLLAYVRSRLSPTEQAALFDPLIRAAYAQTTTLSASLIECASNGSADERLIRACDALISAELSPEKIYALLTAYGSSSGLDAFTGMAAWWV